MKEFIPLFEISEIIRGVTFGATDSSKNKFHDSIPVLRAGNIADSIHLEEDLIWLSSKKIKKEQLLKKNDIVMCTSSGSPQIVGKSALFTHDWIGSFGAFCAVIRPKEGISASFLAHFLRSPKFRQWSANSSGANIKNIRISELAEFPIPNFQINEQKRIAAILDKADAIRRKREKSIELIDSFLKSVFFETFGDPSINTKKWNIVCLSEVVESLEGGKNIKTDDAESEDTQFKILKVSAVTSGEYDYTESKPVPKEFIPPDSYIVKPGDLLISRANTSELIGATAYVWNTPSNIILPDKIWRFKWCNSKNISPLYFNYLLKHPSIRSEITKRSSGTSGSMKNIAKPKLLSIKVPLPPIDQQDRFAEIVKKAWQLKLNISDAASKSEKLTRSLTNLIFQ